MLPYVWWHIETLVLCHRSVVYIYIYQLSLIVRSWWIFLGVSCFSMWQYQTLMAWCNLKEVGWGWTSTMKIMDLKITVDSSGEDELVRNPSSSSVLMQQLSSVKTAWFWGWSGGGRYAKHLRGWDLVGSKDVGEILLHCCERWTPKWNPSCSGATCCYCISLVSIWYIYI